MARQERTLLQEVARREPMAREAIGLARTQYDRALRELPGALEARDYDEPYLNVYRSVISGCKRLLAAYGYRVRGGDGAHFDTLRLGSAALAVWDQASGKLLEDVRESFRSARNEAEYQRAGVTTPAELDEIFDVAVKILPAISRALETMINAERLIADEWVKPAVQADG